MFSIEARQDPSGCLMVMGDERVIGSLAMGTGALLEWALDELKRHSISLEARPRA